MASMKSTLLMRLAFTLKMILIIIYQNPVTLHAESQAQGQVRRMVLILDYVAADYVLAVSNGQVLDKAEYTEMVLFAETARDLGSRLPQDRPEVVRIHSGLDELGGLIDRRAAPGSVSKICVEIRGLVLEAYPLPLAPVQPPDYSRGQTLFNKECVLCHGLDGSGDTPMAETLKPRPRSFLNPEVMETLTPFRAFNTMTLGLEGTSMVPFTHLNPDERWDLAYYLFTLQFSSTEEDQGHALWLKIQNPPPLDYRDLASTPDAVLAANLLGRDLAKSEEKNLAAFLRRRLAFQGKTPALFKAESLLTLSLHAARAGRRLRASELALDAYLQGFESVERLLLVSHRPLARQGEKLFLDYRSALDSDASMAVVQNLHQRLVSLLNQSRQALDESSGLSPRIAFFSSFIILFREGLEAVLVISAILALLTVSGIPGAARWVHAGWFAALVAGAATWALARWLIEITAMEREILEGLSALLAAAVLFYVSFWLLSRAEAKVWKDFIETKIRKAMDRRRLWVLGGVSFLAVYREVFETILFYQVLLSQETQSRKAIFSGAGAGAVCLGLLAVALFRFQVRIPLRYFFLVTSGLLYLLSMILAGQGLHELQEAGWISATTAPVPEVPFLGIFATWETLGIQGTMAGALGMGLAWLAWGKKQKP